MNNQSANHYSEFSLDEFKKPLTVEGLCKAIKEDNYGIKFHHSSDNSIGRLNEILECTDLYEKLISKYSVHKWSANVVYLANITRLSREGGKTFSELAHNDQIDIKRLNRLCLEEVYPGQTPTRSKYFIPPGLLGAVDAFEDHCKVADTDPILIVGPTGVGKSLFLHIFEKLYRENHEDEKKYPIIKANCAHFGGDPNLVRSELFGHMEGSFTGAKYEKSGLVEMADGGVLILEEIGDLPLETQAMLLTFIETGEFFRVGDDRDERIKRRQAKKKTTQEQNQSTTSTEAAGSFYREDSEIATEPAEPADSDREQRRGPRKANVQIVGLTNREENLRDDFNFRFFPFYITPIHQRREDILYYFHAIFPDLFDSMKPFEILTLMTYHWPGNVREIERHGRLMRRAREGMKRMTFSSESERSSFEAVKLYNLDPNSPHKTIDAQQVRILRDNFMEKHVDVELLESILNKYQVGLEESLDMKDFIVGDQGILSRDVSERYGLRFTYHIESFNQAYQGITAFAELFYQDPMANVNLLDLKDDFVFSDPFDELIQYPKDDKDRFQKLIKCIFEFLSGIILHEADTISENIFERDEFFATLGRANPGNHFLASLGFTEPITERKTKDLDITSLKPDELMKLYYQKFLDRAQGNQAKAAKLAGIPYTTFCDSLRSYGIRAGRKAKMESNLS